MVFFDKIFHTPLPPSPPKKKSTKKRVYPLLIRILFFLTAMIYFIFGLKRNGMKL